MAGEPSLYLVYQDFTTDERNNGSWHGTQAAADDAANDGGSDFTAHQGAVAIPNGWETGWIYHPTNDTWRELGVDDLPEVEQRRYSATVLYEVLDGMLGNLSTVVAPTKDIGRVTDVIAFAKWAAFVVFTSGTWTGAQQIAWAQSMMLGPTDGEDLKTLTRAVHGLADAVVPMGAFTWANPADAVRVTLAEAEPASVRWFSSVDRDLTMSDVDGDGWIKVLAAA